MASKTNIILITLDALRADHLSGYGYDRDTAPTLAAFGDEAVTFEQAYSASSHTREAVPALLTGRYPDDAVGNGFQRDAPTVGRLLSDNEYRTGGFHSNPFVSRAYGFDDGFDHFDDDLHLGQNKLLALAQRALDKLRNRHYARATEINQRSLEWLDTLDDEPFFCWNHYMDPHGPYEAPPEYQRTYHGEVVPDRTAQRLYQRAIDSPESISDSERELLRDLYDAEIAYTDDKLSEFFDSLRDSGLFEESLIIVTADHGDAFGEHGYYEHPRQLHDELVHVPLLVSGPEMEATTVEAPTSTLDVVPTILSTAGIDGEELPGNNLHEIAADPDSYTGRCVISQARGEDENSHIRRFSARKLSSTWFGTYDMTDETLDLDGPGDMSEEAPRILRDHIESRLDGTNDLADDADEDVDDEIEDRLSALGYK